MPGSRMRRGPSPPLPPARRFIEPAVDVHELLDRLEREDAVAMPALTGEYRVWLLEEARTVRFREARPIVGSGGRTVHQRMGVFDGFGPASRFHDLTGAYQALWDAWLAPMIPCPFESRLVFNDRMLQVYEPGEIGITPHMDRHRLPVPDLPVRARWPRPVRRLPRTEADAARGSFPTSPAMWC